MDAKTYHDEVQTAVKFTDLAAGYLTFQQLKAIKDKRTANRWGRGGLFACRVLCRPADPELRLLKKFMPTTSKLLSAHPHMSSFWAALGVIVSRGDGLASLRLLRAFFNCVFRYIRVSEEGAFRPEVRYETFVYEEATTETKFSHDDGSVCLSRAGRTDIHVASMKAKFAERTYGTPFVSDDVLVQIVLEAYILRCSNRACRVPGSDFVTIYIAGTSVKFLHLRLTDKLHDVLKSPPTKPRMDAESFLQVESTQWFDLTDKAGRKSTAKHAAALADWAKYIAGDPKCESSIAGKSNTFVHLFHFSEGTATPESSPHAPVQSARGPRREIILGFEV